MPVTSLKRMMGRRSTGISNVKLQLLQQLKRKKDAQDQLKRDSEEKTIQFTQNYFTKVFSSVCVRPFLSYHTISSPQPISSQTNLLPVLRGAAQEATGEGRMSTSILQECGE